MTLTASDVPVRVQIIGAPIFTCRDGLEDAWRNLGRWAEQRLKQSYGDAVVVAYYDLLDPACPALPAAAQLPVVLVNDQVAIAGGKINMPIIRRHIDEVLEQAAQTQPSHTL